LFKAGFSLLLTTSKIFVVLRKLKIIVRYFENNRTRYFENNVSVRFGNNRTQYFESCRFFVSIRLENIRTSCWLNSTTNHCILKHKHETNRMYYWQKKTHNKIICFKFLLITFSMLLTKIYCVFFSRFVRNTKKIYVYRDSNPCPTYKMTGALPSDLHRHVLVIVGFESWYEQKNDRVCTLFCSYKDLDSWYSTCKAMCQH